MTLRTGAGLADEKDNLKALLDATDSGGALESYSIEIFGNQAGAPTKSI